MCAYVKMTEMSIQCNVSLIFNMFFIIFRQCLLFIITLSFELAFTRTEHKLHYFKGTN